MTWSRRAVLTAGLGLAATAGAAPAQDADASVFAALDDAGPLLGDAFEPKRALAAMSALMALAPEPRVAALRRYVEQRGATPPEGLFAVIRALVKAPDERQASEPWPGVLHPGFLRPPALGAPEPPQPRDLAAWPRWPVLVVGDVPLVLVRAYALGGMPEPLSMHLDGLARATWRTEPLRPEPAAAIRARLTKLALDADAAALVHGQLERLG